MFIGWEIIYLKSPERWFSKINEFTNLRWDFTWSSPMFKRSKRKNLGNFQTPVESWGPQRFTNIRDVFLAKNDEEHIPMFSKNYPTNTYKYPINAPLERWLIIFNHPIVI
jgi:hypothetical protein